MRAVGLGVLVASGWKRALTIHPAAEAATVFLTSAALFLFTAALPIRGHPIPIVLAGAVSVAIVSLAARRYGPLLAVPLAIAGGLGFDAFLIPPTRAFGREDWQNWLVMVIYIATGVLIGMVGARAQRRAEMLAAANMRARAELDLSRARIVEATDQERRRVVRDLHDGAQQRLVHTVVTLKLAQQALHEDPGAVEPLVAEALDHANRANAELRELAHGILPAALTRGGLRAGVDALVSRIDLPVTVTVPVERFSPRIEASAYFVVAEALTNVLKHSRAERADVRAAVEDHTLRLEVRDDGIGGAQPHGTGLVGVEDRLVALGGQLWVDSPAGGGTVVQATLPLPA